MITSWSKHTPFMLREQTFKYCTKTQFPFNLIDLFKNNTIQEINGENLVFFYSGRLDILIQLNICKFLINLLVIYFALKCIFQFHVSEVLCRPSKWIMSLTSVNNIKFTISKILCFHLRIILTWLFSSSGISALDGRRIAKRQECLQSLDTKYL